MVELTTWHYSEDVEGNIRPSETKIPDTLHSHNFRTEMRAWVDLGSNSPQMCVCGVGEDALNSGDEALDHIGFGNSVLYS